MRLIVSQPPRPLPSEKREAPAPALHSKNHSSSPRGVSRYGDVLRQWPHVKGSLGAISGLELRHEEEEEDVETAGDEFPAAGHKKPEMFPFVCHNSPLTCS